MINKIKLRCSVLFCSVLFCSVLNAQTPQFMLKETKLDNTLKEKIKENVEDYETFELNTASIDRYLKSYVPNSEIPLKITIAPGRVVECKIVEDEIRAANYTHLVVKKDMTEMLPMGRCDTYKSVDRTNGSNTLLFASSAYFSLSFFENGERKTLVSLSRFTNTDASKNFKSIVVLYKDSNLKKSGYGCSETFKVDTLAARPLENTANTRATRFLELAVVVDYDLVFRKGDMEQSIRALIHQVSNRYETDFQLAIKIVYYEQFNSPPSNNLFSGSLQSRWEQLREYFNPVSPANPSNPSKPYIGTRACVPRDLVHLFTFRESDYAGVVVGNDPAVTGSKSVCGTSDDIYLSTGPGFCNDRTGLAYGVTNGRVLNWTNTAHEIGHNFGAGHTSCGIMCPNTCQCSPEEFSSDSKLFINGHIFGTGTVDLACPPHKRGDCLFNVPIEPNQVSIAGPYLVCDGSATFSTNTKVWAIWSSDDPDVSILFGTVVDWNVTAYCTTPGLHHVNATFVHNCQLVTMIKYFWVGSPQQPDVYTSEDGCDSGSGTCSTLSFSFNKETTQGLNNFTFSTQNCSWCNVYSTGSFEAGTITLWNIHAGECVSVSGTAFNDCNTTDFSQVYCNGSIPQREEDIQVKAYPNPTNNTLYLVSKNAGTISIWDVLGKQLNTYTVEAHSETKVNTTDFAAGIYIVKFDTPEAKIIKKITISH